MWRQIPDNPDSDRSISDEEEFDRRFPENCIALGDKMDDFVCFSRNASMLHSDEEMISSDEESREYSLFSATSRARDSQKATFHSFKNEKQGQADTWQSISEEADALVRANERASSSNTNKFHKAGDKGKVKPKFSILPRSYKDEVFLQSFLEKGDIASSKNERCMEYKMLEPNEGMKDGECRNLHNSTIEFLEDLEEDSDQQPVTSIVSVEVEAVEYVYKPSVAELLDGLQDKSGPLRGNSEKYIRNKVRSQQLVVKRVTDTLGERTVDGEDPPETMSSSSSSDSETNEQNLQLVMPETTRQTMAEMFQEALGFVISSDEGVLLPAPKPLGTGLFGKLQQIVLAEKDKDAHFLTTMQTRDKQFDEATCIDVRILSRYLEAKLIICRCVFSNKRKYAENTKAVAENDLVERSVIFNPRVCGDIELEVGSMIRIHPPWKEVRALTNDERVILCTYFSQIL